MSSATWLLTRRTLIQFPRNPMVLGTTIPGIANAAVGLATDIQSRYLHKLLTMPVSLGSVIAGRLLADGARLFVQAGAALLLAIALGSQIASGFAGALLMLLIGALFGIVTFGVLTANLALKTKDPQAVQAVFPMAFLLIFLTTAYQTEEQVPSGVLRAVMSVNPTEYVLQAMRDLMLTGFEWGSIGVAFAVIARLTLVGLPLTIRNFRSVYR